MVCGCPHGRPWGASRPMLPSIAVRHAAAAKRTLNKGRLAADCQGTRGSLVAYFGLSASAHFLKEVPTLGAKGA